MDFAYKELLTAIHKTTHIRPTVFDSSNQILYTAHVNAEERLSNLTEYLSLVELCRESKAAHIIISGHQLAIAGVYVKESEAVVLLGHVFLGTKSEREVQLQLLKNYKDEDVVKQYLKDIMGLHVCSKATLLLVMNLLSTYLNHEELDECVDKFIIKVMETKGTSSFASITDDFLLSEETQIVMNPYDDYLFEQRLMDCIEKGDKERLLSTLKYDQTKFTAALCEDDNLLRQRKNEFICACTLATRAAIRGGMNVEQAYAMGNYYIKQNESLLNSELVGKTVNEMFLDFTMRVESLVKINPFSSMVKDCIVYINDHVHDAISIQDMADKIGVSKNHLLMKFREETKQSMVDYIKNVKISEAKLLLEFSNMPIVEISESLSFSSQSFFTATFREFCKQTPKEYRTTHK